VGCVCVRVWVLGGKGVGGNLHAKICHPEIWRFREDCFWYCAKVVATQSELLLQRVAVCCSVLQCVAVCCSVLQCIAVCCNRRMNTLLLLNRSSCCSVFQHVAACCSVLQRVAACCSVLQCFAIRE